MTRIAWWSVNVVAQSLNHDDREAVEGDFAESRASAFQALRDVLGFVLRRHAMLWKTRRPWLAAFGVALPGALLLAGFSLTVSRTYQLYAWIVENYGYIDPKILNQTGLTLRPGIWLLICQVFLLTAWSWTGGFVVSSLSRRTLWVSAALCFLSCLVCLSCFRHQTPSNLCLFLFLFPAVWGVRKGLRLTRMKLRPALLLAAAVTLLSIPVSNRDRWIFNCALSWPAWYLVATAHKLAFRVQPAPTEPRP